MNSPQVNPSSKLYSFQANESVLLNDSERFWVVQSGTLAVFATRVKNSLPKEHRRYLFHVSAGEALFSAVLLPEVVAQSQWSFVAIAIEPTQLCQISMVDLVQGIAAVDSQTIELLEGWVNHLGQSLNAQQTVLTTPLNQVSAFERDFSLSHGETLQCRQQTLRWLRLQQGNTHWMGVEELALNSTSPAFPITNAMWLEAENAVIGEMLSTADLKNSEELLTGLASLQTYFFHYFSLLANKEAEAEFQQFQEREQFNQQVIEAALSDLAAVLQPQQEAVFFQEGSPLLVALSIAEASDAIEKITGIKRSPTQVREFLKRIGLRCLKVGYVPGKSVEEKKIEEVKKYKVETLEPLLAEAINGEKAVFFVDAAHFVHRAYKVFIWCFARTFICSPSGRKRFNVLGAVNAVSKEIITITNETYINSESICQLLFKLANLGLSIPIILVLDNAKYQKCKLVQDYAEQLGIQLCYLPYYSPQLNLIERFWKFIRNECLYSKYYASFADFKAAISNCIDTANTGKQEKLDSLLVLNFQTFEKVQILAV